MHLLAKIPVSTLRRAAAKLARRGRSDGIERAIWMAAKNYRAERDTTIELSKPIVERAEQLLIENQDARE